MNRVGIDNRQTARWLPDFLIGTGLVRVREGQKLLMEPVADLPSKRNKKTNFDPELERGYLARLPDEMRLAQLQKEVVTTLTEVHFSQMGHAYRLVDGFLLDDETGQNVEELTVNGGTKEEILAIRKIRQYLSGGADLVVNISPEDENLAYPDNMVDIWLRCEDGKIRVLRYKTVGDIETFKRFYKDIGGTVVNPTKDQILSDPVVPAGLRLSDVLNLLMMEKNEERFGQRDIDVVAGHIMDEFRRKFGSEMVHSSKNIMRYYLAVKLEVDKLKRTGMATKVVVEKIIRDLPIEMYLNSNFKVTSEKGAGCASETPGGAFENQGWILTVVDGKMVSHFGSTEGLTYCEGCGCWHSGDKCPFCDLHYTANC